jgi:hypothetical protein
MRTKPGSQGQSRESSSETSQLKIPRHIRIGIDVRQQVVSQLVNQRRSVAFVDDRALLKESVESVQALAIKVGLFNDRSHCGEPLDDVGTLDAHAREEELDVVGVVPQNAPSVAVLATDRGQLGRGRGHAPNMRPIRPGVKF